MTKKLISATYHPNIQVAEFIADDGSRCLRSGGTLPWRINNCGDLSSPVNSQGEPNPKRTKDFIGFAKIQSKNGAEDHHFFIFPDYATGREQLKASLKRKYATKTIPETIDKYAPSGDNDTAAYRKHVLNETGIAADKKVGDLTDDEITGLADAIQKVEGYNNGQETRRELWVPVSTIVATDGARPLAEQEIVLRVNGKDTIVKSNSVGQFPLIVHATGPVEVLHRISDSQLRSVGTISGDKGERFSFWNNVAAWAGYSAPENPPETSKSRPQPMTYVVQPGDSLSKIAVRFKTAVDKIKQDNQLRDDTIHPGDRLGIFGAVSVFSAQKALPKKQSPPGTASSESSSSEFMPDGKASLAGAPVRKPPISTTASKSARSAGGAGKPIGIIPAEQGRAPWMAYAISEAKRLKGKKEAGIMKDGTNYHMAIHDTIKTLVGDTNAWCAAFVNWCLSQSGYAIDNGIWAARAHGFISHDAKYSPKKFTQNPLFTRIDEPIYGAITVVASRSGGRGHHAGLVYAQESETSLAILGGNQSNELKFASYLKVGIGSVLWFYVPTVYARHSKLDSAKNDLLKGTSVQLNKDFEINVTNTKDGEER